MSDTITKFYVKSGGSLNTRSGHTSEGNILVDEDPGNLDLTYLQRTDEPYTSKFMVVGGATGTLPIGAPVNVVDAKSPKSVGTNWTVIGRYVNTEMSLKELETNAGKNILRYGILD